MPLLPSRAWADPERPVVATKIGTDAERSLGAAGAGRRPGGGDEPGPWEQPPIPPSGARSPYGRPVPTQQPWGTLPSTSLYGPSNPHPARKPWPPQDDPGGWPPNHR
jgi:hypothetical protein